MRQLFGSLALLAFFAHASTAMAQPQGDEKAGRWVRQGTYALSGFAANPEREKTYLGAARERSRLLSYLPQMTLVFPETAGMVDRATVLQGYEPGITHTGTPVLVLDEELSTAKIGSYPTHDVVVHVAHYACKEPYCESAQIDGQRVGAGFSFKIEEETQSLVYLVHPTDEIYLYYRAEEFDELERSGQLTRTKGRSHPRWDIREGYANDLSVGCGGEHPAGKKFTVDAGAYEATPDTWAVNAPQWSVKAIDLFVGGHVEKTDETFTAEISERIHDVTKGADDRDDYKSAIDFTVVAYRDNNLPDSEYEFAVLISIVACEKPGDFGNFTPRYVREAHLHFENNAYLLPQQITELGKKELSRRINRSLMYSVNTPAQYEDLFGRLGEELQVRDSDARANLVPVILGRLNATCDEKSRASCAERVANTAVPAH